MAMYKILNNSLTFKILLCLNFIIGFVVFIAFLDQTGGDTYTYTGLADGLLHGRYSFWYFTPDYYPDTFRNPGYPIFLIPFRFVTESLLPIQIFQLLLYFLSVFLVLKIIDKFYNSLVIKNIFLFLLVPSIHVVSYTTSIFPEIPVTFLMLCIIWLNITLGETSWKKHLFLGLLFGLLFQIRPVILFIPFILVIYKWFSNKNFSLPGNFVMLVIFGASLLPYGLWNKKHHGVFKITSIEGGGGVFHTGFWVFKIPDYYEPRYWGNYFPREMISLVDEQYRDQNIKAFNEEWDKIDSAITPLLTHKDSVMINLQTGYPKLFKTYSGPYTIKREEMLKKYTFDNIKTEFPYYLKVKIYTAFRLWITGIPMRDFVKASFFKKLYLIYPFLLTLSTFLAAIILIPVTFYKHKETRNNLMLILIITLYFGFLHIPFAIQARYTIPVRLELLLMIAVSVYMIFFRRHVQNKTH